MTSKRIVLLVDGMALLFRAYYASSYSGYIKRTSAGLPTNAVHGFVKYMMDAVKRFRPTHVVCCWDMGSTTFRTEQYADYKGNRESPPDDLIPQFDLVKEVVDSFGVPNVGIRGYEADDCIGTLARHYAEEEAHVFVLTGDHDLLQVVSERVHVVIMKKGASNYAVYDEAALLEERGLTPRQIIELKGLTGDTSDNYPGVKGIGEKTALKLLAEYGDIDGILANLDSLTASVRKKIEASLDMLHLSRDLATIRCDTPVSCPIDDCVWAPDLLRLRAKFEELEFKGLAQQIG
ncbi:5'-3' exonuclease [Paenibacillus flagellatus]|uniref:5'-3' exonuclease n=1 Tax=Paenibacillus flagellatus TaxID=2211139 RepID=A0A2V5KD15_9BACL|nr:5'-3' exonuclease H3TH domain-containing protein [Paenibacillus flagellatus]PYI57458.1 flap endonuclease [Paenibacillus flagellatus]